MAEIIRFPGITSLDLNPDDVLSECMGELAEVVIVGVDKDGDRFFASSQANGGEVLWHLERAKFALMRIAEKLEGGEDV